MKTTNKTVTLFMSTLALSLGLILATPTPSANAAIPPSIEGKPLPSLAPMLEKVLPAVVSLRTEGKQAQRQQLPPELKFFFGPNFPTEQQDVRPFQGLGSGVIIDAKKGYLVTNNHVINNADTINVSMSDGREFSAKLIGRDEQSDIAILQLKDANNLTEVKIADSDQLKVGDFAVAVGNPFGIGQTATSGIISALGRTGLNIEGFENFIQTDASINRGNSGGALINLNGELIGINTAILAPNGGNIGIGFAIPSNMVKNLAQQLIEFGEVKRGLLGIKGNEMTADMAKALNIDTRRGAFVSEVVPNSAAAKAGIKAGDVITSFDGKPVSSFAELRAKVATTGPKNVQIGLLRDGKQLNLGVKLDNNDQATTNADSLIPALQGATFNNGEANGIKGVKIDDVTKDSPAAQYGLQKNDLIIAVNRRPVENLNQFRKLVEDKPTVIALNIVRGGENIYLILR